MTSKASEQLKIRIISAGAGSGKTYRLTEELATILSEIGEADVRASGIIGTTFTIAAAAELREKVREKLIHKGMSEKANELLSANIGTVNAVCSKILEQFCYEAGLPPELEVIEEEQGDLIFSRALKLVVTKKTGAELFHLSGKFGYNKSGFKGKSKSWKDDVLAIVKLARSNNIVPADLKEHGDKSVESMLEHMPAVGKRDLTGLKEQLNMTIDRIVTDFADGAQDGGKGTKAYIDFIMGCKGKRLDYGAWADLAASSKKLGKKSMQYFHDIKDIACEIEGTPELQNDIKTYITKIYEIAKVALDAYRSYKAERGLIDFIDQEEQVLKLLDNDQVKERLEEELDLLLVDEFQDTSPIQLAVFLKLATLAKKTIWVGDPKQSIYAFRDADPALMLNMIELLGGVKKEDIQNTSYRSRGDLVKTVNATFKNLFDTSEEQIVLKPNRPESAEFSQALNIWQFQKAVSDGAASEESYLRELARSIKIYLAQNIMVAEKVEETLRPLEPGDICVLLRSNKDCDYLAASLEEEGVRVAIERKGLAETREGAFMRACLNLLADPRNALAKMEIQVFAPNDASVGDILNSRLASLEKKDQESWGADHPWIATLTELGKEIGEASVSEIIDRILIDLNFREFVRKWGNADLRNANVEKFRQLAAEYEFESLKRAASTTLSGFLVWMGKKDELNQAAGAGSNAVNISTYHRSKGLEWPVVICGHLDKEARVNYFGSKIVDERDTIDVEKPLDQRWIKTWINPASGPGKGLPFEARLDEGPIFDALLDESIKEGIRLLYVGMTRARDYLILASRKFNWIEQAFRKYEIDMPLKLVEAKEMELPWSKDIKAIGNIMEMKKLDQYKQTGFDPETIICLKEKAGKKEHVNYFITPSSAEGDTSPFQGECFAYSERLALSGKVDSDVLGTALHNLICLGADVTLDQITQTLDGYQIKGVVAPVELKEKLGVFQATLLDKWPEAVVHSELQVRAKENGQVTNGIVDMLIELDDGLILIDHKSYPGKKSELAAKAGSYRPQLEIYKKVLEKSFKKPVKEVYINFFTLGCLVGME